MVVGIIYLKQELHKINKETEGLIKHIGIHNSKPKVNLRVTKDSDLITISRPIYLMA